MQKLNFIFIILLLASCEPSVESAFNSEYQVMIFGHNENFSFVVPMTTCDNENNYTGIIRVANENGAEILEQGHLTNGFRDGEWEYQDIQRHQFIKKCLDIWEADFTKISLPCDSREVNFYENGITAKFDIHASKKIECTFEAMYLNDSIFSPTLEWIPEDLDTTSGKFDLGRIFNCLGSAIFLHERGNDPYLQYVTIPRGNFVQVTLHHSACSIEDTPQIRNLFFVILRNLSFHHEKVFPMIDCNFSIDLLKSYKDETSQTTKQGN